MNDLNRCGTTLLIAACMLTIGCHSIERKHALRDCSPRDIAQAELDLMVLTGQIAENLKIGRKPDAASSRMSISLNSYLNRCRRNDHES